MVSVIIPTYQSPEILDLCLQSAIKGQVNKNQIVVVVDGYYEVNKNILEKHAKYIDILNLEQNVGLCRGTNLGVYNATSDRVLVVNDDNVFPKGWDLALEEVYSPNSVITPNQIEPYPSIFKQFDIQDLGTDPKTFDLERFWEYASQISKNVIEDSGSTLPIFMSKEKYIALGGWDENYEQGMVSDWDFFLKCQLMGLTMMRTYNCHFYHFASMSVNGEKRRQAEIRGHEYAAYKWGSYIKSYPHNNLKYI